MVLQSAENPERKRRRIQPSSEDECESDGDGCESVSSDGSDSMGSLRDFIVDGSCSEGEGEESDGDGTSSCTDESDGEGEAEDCGSHCPDWIDTSNIVVGKRTRRNVSRYQDPQYRQLMLEDCDSDLTSSEEEEEEEAADADSDGSFRASPTEMEEESDSGDAETPTIEKEADAAGQ